jgi:hypothetical protein
VSSFQDDQDPVFFRKLPGELYPSGLDLGGCESQEPAQFAGVGRDDDLGFALEKNGR